MITESELLPILKRMLRRLQDAGPDYDVAIDHMSNLVDLCIKERMQYDAEIAELRGQIAMLERLLIRHEKKGVLNTKVKKQRR
jgi:hypothetical protein